MRWFRRQLLRRALRKEWNPKIVFDIGEWGFTITLINPIPIKMILEDIDADWKEISKLVFEATEEILKFVQYGISDESLRKVGNGVTMNDAKAISSNETRELLHLMWKYEETFSMSINEWYIDYILTRGYNYI